jgi:hypothetical protein
MEVSDKRMVPAGDRCSAERFFSGVWCLAVSYADLTKRTVCRIQQAIHQTPTNLKIYVFT